MTDRLNQLGFAALAGAEGDAAGALRKAAQYSDYIARIERRRPEVIEQLAAGPERVLADALAAMEAAGAIEGPLTEPMRAMRLAKEASHAAIAAADLAGIWSLDEVVGRLTDLADASVKSAMRLAIRTAWASGSLGETRASDEMPGLFALAMGKMGARELNYSSDVDLIVLFDLDMLPMSGARVKEGMLRLTRDLVRIMEERTADGYVFRTDLRLRPDPGSTSLAISTQFATSYYESVGQNWERMAHIKARVCAGDAQVGAGYLKELEPYVWRRHLDYWAISDIHSIKRQIHSHGQHAELHSPDFDVKLGRGGIREIEFFTQVQQLILGGRRPELRSPQTKIALAAMANADIVDPVVVDDLCRSYDFLRSAEHRIQMLNDEQTHHLPDVAEKRSAVAILSGYSDQARFEADIAAVRRRVHGTYSDLFATEEKLSGETGNLVFTGVDDDPGTVETLKSMGFSNPSRIIHVFQQWHRGSIPATRSARAQQLFTSLGPRLLEMMSKAGEPDAAFERFQEFFSGLTSGVQVMSLMLAEPALARDVIETMSFAPKLAADLARRPALMDSMLEPSFRAPLASDAPEARGRKLQNLLERADGFEAQLNAARRFHREEAFRIGYQLLRGAIGAAEAGAAYANLADACVMGLAYVCEQDVLARFPGKIGQWSVCALGKFGGRELTATSDLDLMLIYEPEDDAGVQLATRFVQRLIAALSAPTEEGTLYEVDMQLRPSGRAGPVAVKISSFQSYYRDDAWTWEFMALTRIRPVAGDPDLGRRIVDSARDALRRKAGDPKITADVADMRRRMARERPSRSKWDLKLAPGGLVDIEFVIQHAILTSAADVPGAVIPTSMDAIRAIAAAGRLSPGDAAVLAEGLSFQLNLQQALRIAAGDGFEPDQASPGLKSWLANHLTMKDFSALHARLDVIQSAVAALRKRQLGPLTTELPTTSV
ncbi:MAG: bifunctional [glutamine synthetase] adenylyltransferase/[glutamine synthetase]-adenylyl-L-tyrosine phosphorylase [Alphaproteobacteria bacterium]|nr:MAG: bifunctional [glutamine synthetase] adenylyltransferase/[glutamine synthetase]-adenylyl-L-tyrosine phosphorylase [Alphaproteobacteria bacterium]